MRFSFEHVGLDWKQYVELYARYNRPAEVDLLIGDYSKAKKKLGWEPKMQLMGGLEDTVRWYVDNRDWIEGIRQRGFQSERLGLVKA